MSAASTSWRTRAIEIVCGAPFLIGAFVLALAQGSEHVTYARVFGDPESVVLGSRVCWWIGVGAAGFEGFVGTLLVLAGGRCARWAGVTLYVVLTAMLIVRGIQEGWSVRCGCMGALFDGSVLVGTLRNLVLACALTWLLLRRRERSGSADQA